MGGKNEFNPDYGDDDAAEAMRMLQADDCLRKKRTDEATELVERLEAANDELKEEKMELQAKITQLKLESKTYELRGNELNAYNERFKAENKKLKKALEEIINIRNGYHKDKSIGKCNDMWKVAVQALNT